MIGQLEPTICFDTYWRFAAERQAMYLRRLSNPIGPWTDDPILAGYRFTNAYRASDRVSQYLIQKVQYDERRTQEPAEIVFRTLLFKIFNKIETWEMIEAELGPVSWQSIDLAALDRVLDQAMARGARIYSAAYIMPAPLLNRARKHSNHLALLALMMDENLPGRLQQADSLRQMYEILKPYNGLGPFLAFQYAIDLNYSSAFSFEEGDFVVPGPGALDGISKCFSNTGGMTPTEIIHYVTDRQEQEFKRLNLSFPGLFGRRLQPIDCQNLFCEISKYARVAHPELAGVSGRTKIKQTYTAVPRRLPQPFFPPRWKLNIPDFSAGLSTPLPGEQGSLF